MNKKPLKRREPPGDLAKAPESIKKLIIHHPEELEHNDTVPVLEAIVDEYFEEENKDKNAPVVAAAERFVDLVKQGQPASKAAQSIGTTVKEILDNQQMKKAVEGLMQTAELPAEVRKRMVKAGLNKVFMENVQSPEPKKLKIALEAAKQISADEGMQTPVESGVTINLGDLEVIREKPLSLPGIEPPK